MATASTSKDAVGVQHNKSHENPVYNDADKLAIGPTLGLGVALFFVGMAAWLYSFRWSLLYIILTVVFVFIIAMRSHMYSGASKKFAAVKAILITGVTTIVGLLSLLFGTIASPVLLDVGSFLVKDLGIFGWFIIIAGLIGATIVLLAAVSQLAIKSDKPLDETDTRVNRHSTVAAIVLVVLGLVAFSLTTAFSAGFSREQISAAKQEQSQQKHDACSQAAQLYPADCP